MVIVDLDARMTVSYVMNRMLDQGGRATAGRSASWSPPTTACPDSRQVVRR